jgi:hypothetical protein
VHTRVVDVTTSWTRENKGERERKTEIILSEVVTSCMPWTLTSETEYFVLFSSGHHQFVCVRELTRQEKTTLKNIIRPQQPLWLRRLHNCMDLPRLAGIPNYLQMNATTVWLLVVDGIFSPSHNRSRYEMHAGQTSQINYVHRKYV